MRGTRCTIKLRKPDSKGCNDLLSCDSQIAAFMSPAPNQSERSRVVTELRPGTKDRCSSVDFLWNPETTCAARRRCNAHRETRSGLCNLQHKHLGCPISRDYKDSRPLLTPLAFGHIPSNDLLTSLPAGRGSFSFSLSFTLFYFLSS